jgi:acetyl esterase/lipase
VKLLSLLALLFFAASVSALDAPAENAGDDFPKKTHVFKTVGDVPIHADVYRPADDKVRPVVVWLHGGALINGSRNSVPKQIHDPASSRTSRTVFAGCARRGRGCSASIPSGWSSPAARRGATSRS